MILPIQSRPVDRGATGQSANVQDQVRPQVSCYCNPATKTWYCIVGRNYVNSTKTCTPG